MKRTFSYLAIAAVVGMSLTGCGKKGGGTIVTINGKAISAEEFNSYLALKPTVKVMTPQGPMVAQVSQSLGYQALEDIIRREIKVQLAADQGVAPTSQQIIQELEFRKKLQPNFVQQLTQAGYTLEMIKQDLAQQLAEENLLTKGIKITDADANKYIKEHSKEFIEPAKVNLRYILLKNPADKAKVDKELEANQIFGLVAARYSAAADAAKTQGAFPTHMLDELPQKLRDLVNKTPEMKETPWIQDTSGSWAKFYIDKKSPAKPMKLDETKMSLLKRKLAMQRGQAANDINKHLMDKLKSSKINVEPPSLKDTWKGAFERTIKDEK